MNELYDPKEGFVGDLERQLAAELRRQQRFRPVEKSKRLKRSMRMAALIVLCLAAGVAAAKSVDHFESLRRKALILVRVETAIEVQQARLSMARDLADRTRGRVEGGLSRSDELAQAENQVKLFDHDLHRARLDLEEVHLAGQLPSDELSAPLQDRRDFVAERLQVELDRALDVEAHLRTRMERINALVEAGLVHPSENRQLAGLAQGIGVELEDIRRRLALRAAYLSGELTAAQVGFREISVDTGARLQQKEIALQSAEARFDSVSEAFERGLATALERSQAEHLVDSARAEHRLAATEADLLKDLLVE